MLPAPRDPGSLPAWLVAPVPMQDTQFPSTAVWDRTPGRCEESLAAAAAPGRDRSDITATKPSAKLIKSALQISGLGNGAGVPKPKPWGGQTLTLWGAKPPTPGVQKNPKPRSAKNPQTLEYKDATPGVQNPQSRGAKSTLPGVKPSEPLKVKAPTPRAAKPPAPGRAKRRGCCGAHLHQPGKGSGVLPCLGGGEEEGGILPGGRQRLKGVFFGQRV